MTTAAKPPTVAEYLAGEIVKFGMPLTEVYEAVASNRPTVLESIIVGTAKMPINKVAPLAKVLGIDPAFLLRMVMHEYMPETLAALDDLTPSPILTENERELIKAYRRAAKGTDAVAVICDAKDVVAMVMV